MLSVLKRIVSLAGLAILTGCGGVNLALDVTHPVSYYVPKVINIYPHDTTAFTQGLEIHEGRIYESTGQYGQSVLRQVDRQNGVVTQEVPVAPEYFAEGLTRVGNVLIQLTWQDGIALVYDVNTFQQISQFTYTGEGWGLCYDGVNIWMSNGTAELTVRDARTFAELRRVPVTLYGQPVSKLNELECANSYIYSNIWYSDEIMQIEKLTGRVIGVIDATGLLTEADKAANTSILNGIAYDSQTGHFWLTGKYWPKLFEVTFVPDTRERG